MKVLITGVAGFIGMHLALRLAKEDFEVFGIDNINSYYDTSLKYKRLSQLGVDKELIFYNQKVKGANSFHFIELDLTDAGNLFGLFSKEKFDIVINLAAQAGVRYSITNPKDYIDSNIIGFFNILEACRTFPVNRLIFASSSSVYGNSKTVPFSENDTTDFPVSFYAATKKTNEVMAHTYSHLYNIPAIGLRFFTVYGPWGRPDMAMFLFTKNILEGKPIQVFHKGELLRDFTFIEDIINGIYSILKNNGLRQLKQFDIYNIGNGRPIKVLDFIIEVEKATGKKAIVDYRPMQEGDVLTTYASTKKLLYDFNYQPSTSIQDGVREFVSWYRKYYCI
jgi:UDP-glucuronate 4-epimerase